MKKWNQHCKSFADGLPKKRTNRVSPDSVEATSNPNPKPFRLFARPSPPRPLLSRLPFPDTLSVLVAVDAKQKGVKLAAHYAKFVDLVS